MDAVITDCASFSLCVCFVLSKKMRDKLRMRSPGSSTVWKRKIWKQIHWMKVISSDQAECQGFSFGWATVILARPHDNTALCFSFLSFSLSFFLNYYLHLRKDITKAENKSRHNHMKIKQTDKTKYHIYHDIGESSNPNQWCSQITFFYSLTQIYSVISDK